jgi:hypothetical protein
MRLVIGILESSEKECTFGSWGKWPSTWSTECHSPQYFTTIFMRVLPKTERELGRWWWRWLVIAWPWLSATSSVEFTSVRPCHVHPRPSSRAAPIGFGRIISTVQRTRKAVAPTTMTGRRRMPVQPLIASWHPRSCVHCLSQFGYDVLLVISSQADRLER